MAGKKVANEEKNNLKTMSFWSGKKRVHKTIAMIAVCLIYLVWLVLLFFSFGPGNRIYLITGILSEVQLLLSPLLTLFFFFAPFLAAVNLGYLYTAFSEADALLILNRTYVAKRLFRNLTILSLVIGFLFSAFILMSLRVY